MERRNEEDRARLEREKLTPKERKLILNRISDRKRDIERGEKEQ